jgi:predicted polyphosphate/ATP-dependent NAD kinase
MDQTTLNTNTVSIPTKKVGFIINPVAGMGGAVGLKGTDGKKILKQAIALGAKPVGLMRAETFLAELTPAKPHLELVVGAGNMGETEAKKAGFTCRVIGEAKAETTAQDTKTFAKKITEEKVDLLVYCGGDGTTRDILQAVDRTVPVLGVPTGVKMHSAPFAISPRAAARVAIRFLWEGLPLREAEVMDIDEQAFRAGQLSAELFGYMLSPFEPHLIQGNKVESSTIENEVENQAAIAIYVIEEMKPDEFYILGPGTTTRTVADIMDQKKTLLGVDVFLDKKLIVKDVNEKQLLEKTKDKATKIVVTPIGGQGFIFGRGNQQISSRVIRQVGLDNIVVIATKSKLDRLECLRVDTGDVELDDELKRLGVRVVVDYKTIKEMCVQ